MPFEEVTTLTLYPQDPTLSHGNFSQQAYPFYDRSSSPPFSDGLIPGEAVKRILLGPFALWFLNDFNSLPK